MTDRAWWFLQALLVALCVAAAVRAQDLDLPALPKHMQPLGESAPVTTAQPVDDPRDEPAPVFFGEEIESENGTLCYVLDISGSMRREDRLKRAKSEAKRSIKGLPLSFRFNVVVYHCAVRSLWPALKPANGAAKGEAFAFIDRLEADGGTGTGPACALALSDRQVMAVVLLTDGAPSCGARYVEGHRAMIRSANLQGAPINVFGIGASGGYRAFLLNVAADSLGNYTDVP